MAFENIPPVPTAEAILDGALAAGRGARIQRRRSDTDLTFARKRERERIVAIFQALSHRLNAIPKQFPDLDSLSEFYRQLLANDFDIDQYRQKLARVQNTRKIISSLSTRTRGRIEAAQSADEVEKATKIFIGRTASAIGQLNADLLWLDHVRNTLRQYPTVKERYTVCIAGFPNVGKTTLLAKITGSEAEIANYAFTTKGLNLGYKKFSYTQVQFIDTPGTLARDHMNPIELQAHLALKYLGEIIVYVWDPTETYTLEEQTRLRDNIQQYGKPVYEYLSKQDIARPEQLEVFSGRKYVSAEELLKIVEELATRRD